MQDILDKEKSRWFSWVPVLFGTGIGIYFVLPSEPSRWLTLGIIEFLLLAAYIVRLRPALLTGVFVLAIIAAGFADIQLKTLYLENRLPVPPEGRMYLRGQILSADTNYRGRPRIVLGEMENFSGDHIKGRYRLTLLGRKNVIEVGQCVELVAEVSPLMKANLPGGYQPDRRLFFDGINGSGYVLGSIFDIDCPKPAGFWLREINRWRKNVSSMIAEQLPPEQAAIVAAIVTGNRDLMTPEQVAAYRDSGLAHFLSISGLHMSMIAGLMFFLVRLIMAMIPALSLRYNSKKAAAVLAMFVSAVYLAISGAAVPTQRAFIMTFVVLLAVLFERQAVSMRVLALAALIILVVSPQMLVSISFQLSFAAVTALVAFYERCGKKVERFLSGEKGTLAGKVCRGIFAYLAGIVIADLVASLATLPFSIYHFNRIAVYTSLANLAAGPIIGLMIMPAVLLSLLTIPLGLSWLPLKIAGIGVGLVNDLTEYVASLPHAAAEVYSFPLWGLLLITFGGLWLCLWQQKWRHWGWLLIAAGGLSLLTVKVPDIIAADGGRAVAVKGADGKLHALSGGNRWMKQNWLEKFASSQQKENENLPRPELPETDFDKDIGIAVYGTQIETVRDYIGRRPWNK